MGQFQQAGVPMNLVASGAVSLGPATLLGFYVNSTTGGTIVLKDGGTGGTGGTAVSGTITPAAGTYHRFPAYFTSSCYATIGGAALNVTFFVAAG